MTITLTREEAQSVLDAVSLAMSSHNVMLPSDPPQDAWKARGVQTRLAGAWETLRARLAQPEPEAMAWLVTEDGKPVFLKGDKTPAAHVAKRKPNRKLIPLYAGAA